MNFRRHLSHPANFRVPQITPSSPPSRLLGQTAAKPWRRTGQRAAPSSGKVDDCQVVDAIVGWKTAASTIRSSDRGAGALPAGAGRPRCNRPAAGRSGSDNPVISARSSSGLFAAAVARCVQRHSHQGMPITFAKANRRGVGCCRAALPAGKTRLELAHPENRIAQPGYLPVFTSGGAMPRPCSPEGRAPIGTSPPTTALQSVRHLRAGPAAEHRRPADQTALNHPDRLRISRVNYLGRRVPAGGEQAGRSAPKSWRPGQLITYR